MGKFGGEREIGSPTAGEKTRSGLNRFGPTRLSQISKSKIQAEEASTARQIEDVISAP